MSVVAVKRYDDGFEIAADSITVRGYTQTINNTKSIKLFEYDNLVVGSCGSAEEGQLFRMFLKTHKVANNSEEAVLDLLGTFSDWKYEKTGDSMIENYYIFCIDYTPYAIWNYLVDEVVTYEAIGAGEDYALTALHLGHSAGESVGVAIDLSVYCESPIIKITKRKGSK